MSKEPMAQRPDIKGRRSITREDCLGVAQELAKRFKDAQAGAEGPRTRAALGEAAEGIVAIDPASYPKCIFMTEEEAAALAREGTILTGKPVTAPREPIP